MGGQVFRKEQKGTGESCTVHPFPETLSHLRTGWLMHATDMDTSRRGRQLGIALKRG